MHVNGIELAAPYCGILIQTWPCPGYAGCSEMRFVPQVPLNLVVLFVNNQIQKVKMISVYVRIHNASLWLWVKSSEHVKHFVFLDKLREPFLLEIYVRFYLHRLVKFVPGLTIKLISFSIWRKLCNFLVNTDG